ncbi:hypothetical protein GF395_03325 [Candidatus Uhrbacteria bacterium]|nr:hypothetical protein [Candidatus Uhrbacteria bacterium]
MICALVLQLDRRLVGRWNQPALCYNTQHMKDITPILRSLGLVESEIKTYLTSLQKGALSVLELSKQTGLSRQATYVAIDSLTDRGLMTTTQQGKKTLYTAEHPENLLAYAKRRESEIKDQIQELNRSVKELALQMGGERPVVRMYEGREGIHAIMEDTLLEKPKEICEITDLNAMSTVITEQERKPLRESAIQLKTQVDGLYTDVPPTPPRKFNARYLLPADCHGFKSHIQVYNDKVTFVTFEGKMQAVMIEHGAIANAMRVLFKLAKRELKDARIQDDANEATEK